MVTILCSKYGRMQKKAFFKWTRLCIMVKFCVRKAVFNYTAGGSIMDMSNTYALRLVLDLDTTVTIQYLVENQAKIDG